MEGSRIQGYEKKGREIYLFSDCSLVFQINLVGIEGSDLGETRRSTEQESGGTDGRQTIVRRNRKSVTAPRG